MSEKWCFRFFRTAIGLGLIYTTFSIFRNPNLWFGESRILSDDLYHFFEYYPQFILDFRQQLFAHIFVQNILKILSIISGLCLLFGYFPRTFSAIGFLILSALHWPHSLIGLPGYYLLQFALFVLCFTSEKTKVWTVRFVQVYLINLYLSTTLFKIAESSWQSGEALLLLAQNGSNRLLSFLVNSELDSIATYLVLLIELSVPILLLFRKSRKWAAVLAFAFHALIAVSFGAIFFQLMCMSYLILFFNSSSFKKIFTTD